MTNPSGTLIRDGFRIGYRIEGDGRPALVIGSADYYSRVFSPALREHLRMAFVDHRGFAAPPPDFDPAAVGLEAILDDCEHLRQTLDLGRVVVIGHSGHAYMALEYAKRWPDQVSHVVMIGIAPSLGADMMAAVERAWEESVDPERKALMAENLERLPDRALAALPPDEGFIAHYVRSAPRTWFDPRFDARFLWEGVTPNAVMLHIWGNVFSRIDVGRGLEDVAAPVLLALGRYDYVVAPASTWDPLRPRFTDLTVRVFERSGHTPPLEEAAAFDAELLGWLKRHD